MKSIVRIGRWYTAAAFVFLGVFPVYATWELALGDKVDKLSLAMCGVASLLCATSLITWSRLTKGLILLWAAMNIGMSPWKPLFHIGPAYFYVSIAVILCAGIWLSLPPVQERLRGSVRSA